MLPVSSLEFGFSVSRESEQEVTDRESEQNKREGVETMPPFVQDGWFWLLHEKEAWVPVQLKEQCNGIILAKNADGEVSSCHVYRSLEYIILLKCVTNYAELMCSSLHTVIEDQVHHKKSTVLHFLMSSAVILIQNDSISFASYLAHFSCFSFLCSNSRFPNPCRCNLSTSRVWSR